VGGVETDEVNFPTPRDNQEFTERLAGFRFSHGKTKQADQEELERLDYSKELSHLLLNYSRFLARLAPKRPFKEPKSVNRGSCCFTALN
jgi:hypothetical protein